MFANIEEINRDLTVWRSHPRPPGRTIEMLRDLKTRSQAHEYAQAISESIVQVPREKFLYEEISAMIRGGNILCAQICIKHVALFAVTQAASRLNGRIGTVRRLLKGAFNRHPDAYLRNPLSDAMDLHSMHPGLIRAVIGMIFAVCGNDRDLLGGWAELFFNAGSFDTALELLGGTPSLKPDRLRERVLSGKISFYRNEFAALSKILRELRGIGTTFPGQEDSAAFSRVLLSSLYMWKMHKLGAIPAQLRSLSLIRDRLKGQEQFEMQFIFGLLLYQAARDEEAVKVFRGNLSVDANWMSYPFTCIQMGVFLLSTYKELSVSDERYVASIETLTQSLFPFAANIGAFGYMCEMYGHLGRFHADRRELNLAVEYFMRDLAMSKLYDDREGFPIINNLLGRCLMDRSVTEEGDHRARSLLSGKAFLVRASRGIEHLRPTRQAYILKDLFRLTQMEAILRIQNRTLNVQRMQTHLDNLEGQLLRVALHLNYPEMRTMIERLRLGKSILFRIFSGELPADERILLLLQTIEREESWLNVRVLTS